VREIESQVNASGVTQAVSRQWGNCGSHRGAGRIISPLRIPLWRVVGGYWSRLAFMDGRIQIDSKDIVKKTFKLHIEGKNSDRVLDAVKHEIRQYIKRERRKPLVEGMDFWDFDCKFGSTQEMAESVHFANITVLIDAAATGGAEAFYLELIAKPGVRQTRPASNDLKTAE
jgi:hypothetical protein